MNFRRLLTPWNVGLVAIIIFLVLSRGNAGVNFHDKVVNTLLILPGILVGLSFHEFAHAMMAYKLGDPTPKLDNRISINPKDHIDLVGFIALIFLGFGWGKPVEINPNNFRKPRRDQFLVSVAGVSMNFIIAVLLTLIYRFGINSMGIDFFTEGVAGYIAKIVFFAININIVLMVFNLIPIPPLDGFNAATEIFNLRQYSWYWPVYSRGMLILLIALVFDLVNIVLFPSVNLIMENLNYLGNFF